MPASSRHEQEAKEAINAALALLQRRWCMRILWELRAGALGFRALQAACGDISPTVINRRLAELREGGLVEAGADGNALTPLGRELLPAFEPLMRWAIGWQRAQRGRAMARRLPRGRIARGT